MHLLGLFGPQRAGKTTVTELLRGAKGFLPMSIPEAIRDEVAKLTGLTFKDEEKDVPQASLSGKTPRDLYIYIGQIDTAIPSFWATKIFQRVSPDILKQRGGVIESVGKQPQWDHIVHKACSLGIRPHLISVTRQGFTYKDNRTDIVSFDDPYIIENDGDDDDFKKELGLQVAEVLADVYGSSAEQHATAIEAGLKWANERIES